MLVSMILVFREAMEAGLIVGIVLAATEGVAGRLRWVMGGVLAGLIGAGLVAMSAGALSDAFNGAGQEAFTATILLFAVAMLSWHILWMSQHAREMVAEMKQVGEAVRLGQRSLAALAVVVAVAVLREGAELVLFLFGLLASSHDSAPSLFVGGVAGLALAVLLSFILYRGLVAIPLRHLFGVTNWLIALLAAGMAGQAAAVLHSADLLPGWGEHVWDTSRILADDTMLGRSLHALIGYSARPSGIQLAAWLATLATLAGLSRLISKPRTPTVTAVAVAALLIAAPAARADEPLSIAFTNHRFVPDHLVVPAGVKFKLLVKNNDDTADEFESTELNREKLVAPGQTITVFLGPLDPGNYHIFGDFHQDTAQGILEAK